MDLETSQEAACTLAMYAMSFDDWKSGRIPTGQLQLQEIFLRHRAGTPSAKTAWRDLRKLWQPLGLEHRKAMQAHDQEVHMAVRGPRCPASHHWASMAASYGFLDVSVHLRAAGAPMKPCAAPLLCVRPPEHGEPGSRGNRPACERLP